uniref:Uncharacterized protein n=1 Tax=Desertifilum tharense IPPAS B-1220 TaxID=1781255 RepID=A0ACD5GZE9_9CYAN
MGKKGVGGWGDGEMGGRRELGVRGWGRRGWGMGGWGGLTGFWLKTLQLIEYYLCGNCLMFNF